MVQEAGLWERSIDELVTLYRDIERRHLSLPVFSVAPLLIFTWNWIKFNFCFLLDLFLLVPVNVVVFLRNLLPGRWSYRSFSWPYIRTGVLAAVSWIGRGEAPGIPLVIVGPLVNLLMYGHFRSRFLLLRRHIILDDRISRDERNLLRAKIDQSLEHWPARGFFSGVYNYVLPVSGPLLSLYNLMRPAAPLPSWAAIVAPIIFSYSLAILLSAFMVKRGLFLGGAGHASYYPGRLAGAGVYAAEHRIFESLGVVREEFPLDIALLLFNLILGVPTAVFMGKAELEFLYKLMHMPMPQSTPGPPLITQILPQFVLLTLLTCFAWSRRTKLGRL